MKSLLQSRFWAQFKQQGGWTRQQISLPDLLILERLFWRQLRLWYAPEVTERTVPITKRSLAQLKAALRHTQGSSLPIFARFDFLILATTKKISILKTAGFYKGKETQPEWRQEISLRPPLAEIQQQFSAKGRYNLRVALRSQLSVAWGRLELVSVFHHLYTAAAERNQFQHRNKQYFVQLLTTVPQAEIILVSHNGQPIAAALVTFYAGRATYLYGGVAYDARKLMAPYLLHWEVMQRAKAKRCSVYDLLAVGPQYPGLSRFKAHFGGNTLHYLGSYDLPMRPLLYGIFRLIEKLRSNI